MRPQPEWAAWPQFGPRHDAYGRSSMPMTIVCHPWCRRRPLPPPSRFRWQGFDFPVVMGFEAVRIVLILAAGTLLAGGAASGGIEELYAIEEVRLDASDGHVDGSANRRALRFQSREKKGSAQRPLLADHDDGRAVSIATGLPLPARVRAATEAARIKFGAERRTGGKLPWFILYDLVVIIVVGTDLVAKLSRLRVQGAPTWLLWSSCYYAKLTWALLSFPFLMCATRDPNAAPRLRHRSQYDRSRRRPSARPTLRLMRSLAHPRQVQRARHGRHIAPLQGHRVRPSRQASAAIERCQDQAQGQDRGEGGAAEEPTRRRDPE